MTLPEGQLIIWTLAPPTSHPQQLQVVTEKGKLAVATISSEEFERTMQQWLALSKRKIAPA